MSDLISRQGVSAWLDNMGYAKLADAVMDEDRFPSADRPTGEWVEKDGEIVCSICGNSVSFSRTKDDWVLGRFCQTCGAKMGGLE